jgi:hypothetical protein
MSDLTSPRGGIFQRGSVVVLDSASHLNLQDVNGYVPYLVVEFSRIEKKIFFGGGGVICFPGVPILGGGDN